jgi:amino acid adenylation domain-containing protein
MLRHFRTLLEGIVANPEQRISELQLLTEAEKHQLLVEWNDTKRDYPSDKCIHQLFEARVEKTPSALAVVFEAQQLTYRELNNRANQLAHYLRKAGIGPNVLVGICMERSLELVVALLAVLKAGGAYVPLDASYPKERLAYMLNDSGVPVLLTFQELSRRLPKYGGQTVYLDQEWQKVSGESTANLPNEADENNIAYVIYTSGSSGNPKGVMIPHSSIGNHMMWMLEAFPLAQDDRVAQKTPLSFDASVWEFFAPLISGAQLVLARPEGYRDAEYLVKFLHKERITVLQVGPTLLQMLLQENMAQCASLRRVFCGGEPLSAELHTRFRRQLNVPLINLYGPTEAAIDATYYECRENDSPGWVPIGRPIANTQIYILDQYLAPVPIGVVGEIHIGGDGLARGYLNNPELTAEKFIYHSLGGEPARRLYRTGDHARYLAGGNIEFLGRIDHQVKIRGYRIELGEIEATLAQHPAIRGAIAMVREDHSGDKRLVAYLVVRREQSFDASDVRKHLKQRLPEYMIPSALVLLDEWPLTPSGKVDRGSLPAPGSVQRSEFIAPRTPVEEKIAKIWAEVLRVDRVGMDDNFFELGGHSLLATQVVSRMRVVFNYDIPLRSMFEAPTVADSAAAITRQQARGVSETEMEQLLKELEEMSSEDAARGYKDQLTKLS